MTIEEFMIQLQDILQRDEAIEKDALLHEMDEWDSLAIMACIAFFDRKFDIKTNFQQYRDLQTAVDLAALAKGTIVNESEAAAIPN